MYARAEWLAEGSRVGITATIIASGKVVSIASAILVTGLIRRPLNQTEHDVVRKQHTPFGIMLHSADLPARKARRSTRMTDPIVASDGLTGGPPSFNISDVIHKFYSFE